MCSHIPIPHTETVVTGNRKSHAFSIKNNVFDNIINYNIIYNIIRVYYTRAREQQENI